MIKIDLNKNGRRSRYQPVSKSIFELLTIAHNEIRGHPGAEDYYDEDDFIDPLEAPPKHKKQMTFAEEKEALKRKIKDMDYKKKKAPKYKKEPKDILNDAKCKYIRLLKYDLIFS